MLAIVMHEVLTCEAQVGTIDSVSSTNDLSIIALVGEGMRHSVGCVVVTWCAHTCDCDARAVLLARSSRRWRLRAST
jgi:hypothetical protein